MAKSSQIGLHIWLPMAMEGLYKRAFLKLHYMREHLVIKSWSSFYYINFGKIQDEGQSAGNQLNLGSSETTCEATTNRNTKYNYKFIQWFIGFAEGDGTFIINKDGYLEFKVTQSSTDAQILFFIKKFLGFGTVSVQSKISKTHHYRVRDKKNLLKIINIFNGNLITNYKINQFKLWLASFNTKYKCNIHYIENKQIVSLDNAWLSGFTDAEGCFTSSVYKAKNGKNAITVRYVISQKNDKSFSEHLAKLIKGYVTHVKSYDGYNTVVNFSNLNKILFYLQQYPLKTKKLISYRRWLKVYSLVKNKEHLTEVEIEKIKLLVKTINK